MKSENILKVIAVFKKVLPLAVRVDHLDMIQGEVNERHECGTVHCHGGWFAVGACDLSKEVSYIDGANKMARILEFDNECKLEGWASANHVLWGNKDGWFMFSDNSSFYHPTRRPNGAENLQHIIDHWTEVYERVRATEQPQQPAQPYSIDLTRQLAVLPSDRREVDQPIKVLT